MSRMGQDEASGRVTSVCMHATPLAIQLETSTKM